MKFTGSIPQSIFILLIFATFMAIAGMRAIYRLGPDIDNINSRNTQSLYLIDNMLIAEGNSDLDVFEKNLMLEKTNITEPKEADNIAEIDRIYKKAFYGDYKAKKQLVAELAQLAEINREAIADYTTNVKKLSVTGMWVIAFMLFIVWSTGLIILNRLKNTVINPMKELVDVLDKVKKGNKLRRCPTIAPTNDFQKVYDGVNNLLDR